MLILHENCAIVCVIFLFEMYGNLVRIVGLVKLLTTALAQNHLLFHATERMECHATVSAEPDRPTWYFL
jgi:hypothetical protein